MAENLYIPEAPREMFVNEGKHKSLMKGTTTQKLERVEYVPFRGILVHTVGGLYPKKGFPTPDAIHAINEAKAIIMEGLRYPLLIVYGVERLLASYNRIVNKTLKPHHMKDQYLCPTAYSINNTILHFLVRIGIKQEVASDFAYNFAHIIEYDDAYRYRVQDLMTECDVDKLKQNPRKEILRLLGIAKERDNHIVLAKFEKIAKVILTALWIPKYKKAFLEAVENRVETMRYDTDDWYWVCMRNDYLFGGKTYEERKKEFNQYPKLFEIRY